MNKMSHEVIHYITVQSTRIFGRKTIRNHPVCRLAQQYNGRLALGTAIGVYLYTLGWCCANMYMSRAAHDTEPRSTAGLANTAGASPMRQLPRRWGRSSLAGPGVRVREPFLECFTANKKEVSLPTQVVK
jgi:hypothetical protein